MWKGNIHSGFTALVQCPASIVCYIKRIVVYKALENVSWFLYSFAIVLLRGAEKNGTTMHCKILELPKNPPCFSLKLNIIQATVTTCWRVWNKKDHYLENSSTAAADERMLISAFIRSLLCFTFALRRLQLKFGKTKSAPSAIPFEVKTSLIEEVLLTMPHVPTSRQIVQFFLSSGTINGITTHSNIIPVDQRSRREPV